MEFRTDEPGVLASRTLRETGSAHIDEVDLYDELATFSALSPEEQRKELKRIETANIQPALAADDLTPVSFDFIEQRDVPTREHAEFDRSCEPVFNLIDESQLERNVKGQSWASAEPAFNFIEESSQEASLTSETGQIAAAPADVLRTTSPLEVIDSGAITNEKCELKCDGCGAASCLEELFCLSCGQFLGEMD
jgi:hypothetical protein